MRKLTLDLESIAVETFETHGNDAGTPGTVRAHDAEPTPVVKTLPLSDCFWSACATCGIYC